MNEENGQHVMPYRTFGWVLVTLLCLTFVSVTVVHIDLQAWSVAIALAIACVKGTFVLSYFMHLKFDNPVFKIMVGVVILLFTSFILLTMVDYIFR